MPITHPRIQLTDRDLAVLQAIDRCPLTTDQLLHLSQTFSHPFTQPRLLRRRLQQLCQAGWIQRYPYAIATRGSTPDYFRLTLKGYRILTEPTAKPPTKRAFAEIGVARHHHTRCLSDFLVHVFLSAHTQGYNVVDFARENSLILESGPDRLSPDASFTLLHPDGTRFNFFVELDTGSERIRSQKLTESIEQKLRAYDRYEDLAKERHRVLFVATHSPTRLKRMLDTAQHVVSNPQRSLFYGVLLPALLDQSVRAIVHPCFLDHHHKPVALTPNVPEKIHPTTSPMVDQAGLAMVA